MSSSRRAITARFDSEIAAVGGVYAENLRVLDVTMANQKIIADLPLRDTSAWAVLYHFLLENPSNEPEAVGIRPALFGSLWLALLYGFGTLALTCGIRGEVWFTAETIGVTCTLCYLLCGLGARRPGWASRPSRRSMGYRHAQPCACPPAPAISPAGSH